MKKKMLRFLWGSIFRLAVLCVIVFSWITVFMLNEGKETISAVGEIYMGEMNGQIQRHFSSIINLRMNQVSGIMWRTPPAEVNGDREKMLKELTVSGRAREFPYLALYSKDGTEEIVYGPHMEIRLKDSFMESLNRGERRVVIGTDAAGGNYLLFGISTGYPRGQGYPMNNGKMCSGLVAGCSIEYINDSLALEVNEGLIFSHIIRKDGSFVLKNNGVPGDSYFDWVLNYYKTGRKTPQQMVEDMKRSMELGEDYSAIVGIENENRHIYCSPLPNSEWYLVTIMPHGVLDVAASGQGNQRIIVALSGCAILLAAVMLTFILYLRMSRMQIAELEKAQHEAEQANRAKSEFLSNMSHDIRTPMNAIVGMTVIAIKNIDKPEQVMACLKKIMISSRHLLGLINDVLDMSKIESGKLTLNIDQVSLKETIDSLVSIAQPQIQIKKQSFDIFIRNIRSEMVRCDGVRLSQVLINLLSNAVKFTPEHGRITVTVWQEESPVGESFVRTHFLVKDNGIGMSEEFQKTIFDSFARADSARVQKIEGSGLGMAIARYIVEEMKGTIEVESKLDHGSTFHVTLDLECVLEDREMNLPAWDMLVVDDDQQLCQSAAETLGEIGVHAEWALNGEEALDRTLRRHEEGQDYDIVLLDWKMPDMDGIETARRIRAAVGSQVPILLISAYDWSDIEEEARSAGISGFISKPLFKSTLYGGLHRFAETETEDTGKQQENHLDFTGQRILLAEDNELNGEIARELLSAYGFSVDWAEDGRQCLELFEASEPGYYSAVLMDLRMPVMNGYEATRAIRALTGREEAMQIPIIAMTADAFAEDIQKCMEAGMNAHVAKPLDIRELLRLLQRYIK